ncbi:MAG TPA: hypothetical protein VI112_13060 [Bacteroidia bacterium]|jgi:hypothetical protein
MNEDFNDFIIVDDETGGDVTISRNTQFNNIRANTVVIQENITARLFGTIKKSLVLNKGSRLILHGSILGQVENLGGELFFYAE